MTPEERRRARLQRALSEAERKLQGTRREDYEREIDYRRVVFYWFAGMWQYMGQ